MVRDYMNIAGRELRIEVNWNTVSDFLEMRGYSLSKMSSFTDFSAQDINVLLWCAASEGERLEGRKLDIDIKDLCADLTPEDIQAFLEILGRQMSGGDAEGENPQEAKKKRLHFLSRK